MSGHSKWAQIKHKKAAVDAKKGKIFSRLSRAITIAVGSLGADPKMNYRLAAAIKDAQGANMPSDNILRAIKRASEKGGGELKEVLYEAYGPGGSALIIKAVTDNSNRTTNEVKHTLSEYGGNLGVFGAAMWAFEKKDDEFAAKFPLSLSLEDSRKFEALLEALDELEDVQDVYSNTE